MRCLWAIGLSAATLAGCRRPGAAPAPAATAPLAGPVLAASFPETGPTTGPSATSLPATQVFTGAHGDFHLSYPLTWTSRPSADYVLQLIPSPKASAAATHPVDPATTIQFDVPDLPPHFPGMIRLDLIQHGYVDDLKKSHKGLKVEETTDRTVPGAKARLVRCTWQSAGKSYTDVALMMIHDSSVYILNAEADSVSLPETRAAFDQIAESVRWGK